MIVLLLTIVFSLPVFYEAYITYLILKDKRDTERLAELIRNLHEKIRFDEE